MEEINPVYDLYRSNNLTDLSEAEFLDKYSNPDEAQKVWQTIAIDNKLTDDDFSTFYDKYLKKKDSTSLESSTAPSSEPSLPESPSGTKSPTTQSGFTSEKLNPVPAVSDATATIPVVGRTMSNVEIAQDRQRRYSSAYNNINFRMYGIKNGQKVAPGYMDRIPQISEEAQQIQSQLPALQEIATSPLRKESERIKAKQDFDQLNMKLGQLENEFNTIKGNRARDLQNKFELIKGVSMQKSVAEKELEKNFSYLDQFDKFLTAGVTKSIGSAIEAIGDLSEMNMQLQRGTFGVEQISDEKATDKIGDALVGQADSIISRALSETPENKLWNPTQGFDKLTLQKAALFGTQAISSTVPSVIAALAGGKNAAMASSVIMNYGDAYGSAKESGMDDAKAALVATAITIPVVALDAIGLDWITKASKGTFGKLVTQQTIKSLAATDLSKEAIMTAVNKSFKQSLKQAVTKGAEALAIEPITEGIQGGIQATGIELAKPGGPDENSFANIGYSAAGEALGGLFGAGAMAPIGMYSAYRYNPSAIQVALSVNQDPDFAQDFGDMISNQVETGQMTQEEAAQIATNIEKINTYNAAIPKTVTNSDARTEAISLMNMRDGLFQEIQGKDPAMVSEQQAQIKEIEEKLSLISKTNKPTSVQRPITEPATGAEEPTAEMPSDRSAEGTTPGGATAAQPQAEVGTDQNVGTEEQYKAKVAALSEDNASNDVNEVIALVTPIAQAAKGKGLSARQVLKDLIRTGVLNELSTSEEIDQVEAAIEATLAGEEAANTYNYQESVNELSSMPMPETVEMAAPAIEKVVMNGIAEGKDANQIMADIMASGFLDEMQGQEDIIKLKEIVQQEIDTANGTIAEAQQEGAGAPQAAEATAPTTEEGAGTPQEAAKAEGTGQADKISAAINAIAEKFKMASAKVMNIMNKYNPDGLSDVENLEAAFDIAMKKRAMVKAAEEARFADDSIGGLRLLSKNAGLFTALKGLTKVFSLVGVKVRVLNDKNFNEAVDVFSDGMLDSKRNAIYDPNTKTIFLRVGNVKQTAIHEFVHPLLDIIKELDSNVYANLEERIRGLAAIKPGTGLTYMQWAEQAYKGYSDKTKVNEAITEFMADTLDFAVSVPAMLRAEAISFLNSILSSLGFKSFVSKPVSLQEFMNGTKNLENVLFEALANKRELAIGNELGMEPSYQEKTVQDEIEPGEPIPSGDIDLEIKSDNKFNFKPENNEYEEDQPIIPAGTKMAGFGFMADRMKTGVWKGLDPKSGINIKLQGGPGFPMLKASKKIAGWANSTKAILSTVLNKITKSQTGIGFPVLMTDFAHVSNLTFTKIFEAEIDWLIRSKGPNEQKRILSNINKFIAADLIGKKDLTPKMKEKDGKVVDVNANASLRLLCDPIKNKSGETIGYKPRRYKNLSDLYKDLEATFDLRKAFFSNLIGEGLINPRAKTEKYGLPDMRTVAEQTSDQRFKDVPAGYIVSAVQFDKEKAKEFSADIKKDKNWGSLHTAEAKGVEPHLSYDYILEGNSIGWLQSPFYALDAKGIDPAFSEWIEKTKAKPEGEKSSALQAKIRMSMPEFEIQSQAGNLVEKEGLGKYMTEDGQGNYVFYHRSNLDLTKKGIDPNKLGSNMRTGRDETMAKHPVSMYYTEPDIADVSGDYNHVVMIPKDKVYPADQDPLNLKPEAEKEFRKVFPNISFDNNRAVSWIAKVAADKGYEMVVASWSPRKGFKALRAESVIKHKPKLFEKPSGGLGYGVDVNEKYDFTSNRKNKGYKPEAEIKSQAAADSEIKPVFAKSAELFDKISETEGASKKRSLAQQRRELLSENPSVKFIDDNIGTIYAELEAKGLLKREGNCP